MSGPVYNGVVVDEQQPQAAFDSNPKPNPNPPCTQEVLMDFPQLTMTLPDGREESIMKRTTLVRARFTTFLPVNLTSSMQTGRLLGVFFPCPA